MNEVYLDYNGSAPVDPRVFEAMVPVLRDGVGNASSAHRFGRRQVALVDAARERVAALVDASASGVVFCAGATEANNLALIGLAECAPADRNRFVVSAVEHASVLGPARWLHGQGRAKVDVVGVTRGGFVDLDELDSLMGPDVVAVSIVAANSETGVLNSIGEAAERAHVAGAVFHCDATQMAARLPLSMGECDIDLLSLSGHKMCGPGGVGALVGTRRALGRLRPVVHGGGHERGLRALLAGQLLPGPRPQPASSGAVIAGSADRLRAHRHPPGRQGRDGRKGRLPLTEALLGGRGQLGAAGRFRSFGPGRTAERCRPSLPAIAAGPDPACAIASIRARSPGRKRRTMLRTSTGRLRCMLTGHHGRSGATNTGGVGLGSGRGVPRPMI